MKTCVALIGLLFFMSAQAQETLGSFIGSLDETSQGFLQNEEDLDHVPYEVRSIDGATHVLIKEEDPKRGEFLLMLGAGIGLINTYGAHGTILRRRPDGRLSWFVQVKGTSFVPLTAPNTINVGVGLYPFKKPILGLALNLTKPTYAPYVAVTPEVSANAYIGKRQQLRVYTSLSANYYPTVRNYKGSTGSFIPELEFGVALRLIKVKK